MSLDPPPPRSILIIGSGVFGLSTALALAQRPQFLPTRITLLDRLPFPSVDGSSVDSSRIVRADYSDPAYSLLCAEAQRIWRGDAPGNILNDIGKEGRYTQSGLVLTEDEHTSAEAGYVRKAYDTVVRIGRDSVRLLPTQEEVEDVCSGGGRSGTGGKYGGKGYVNYSSGWADAQESLSFVRRVLERTGRVSFRVGEVARLLESSSSSHDRVVVDGAVLKSGEVIRADLTVLATGAWTPGLLDMSGRAVATGQVLAYLRISEEEWEAVRDMPVVFNLTRGIFIIPHHKRELKIARHASGYLNPVTTKEGNTFSLPRTAVTHPGTEIPQEAQQMLYQELWEMMPRFKGKRWESTRLCWYTDTPTGNFIVTYHPQKQRLFLATGGSGHAFKFLPVLGEHVVDILERKPDARLRDKWKWPETEVETVETRDGSRCLGSQKELDRAYNAAKLGGQKELDKAANCSA